MDTSLAHLTWRAAHGQRISALKCVATLRLATRATRTVSPHRVQIKQIMRPVDQRQSAAAATRGPMNRAGYRLITW